MVRLIFTFATGFVAGIAATLSHVRILRGKVRFYESYIHRRLEDSVPHLTEHLKHH